MFKKIIIWLYERYVKVDNDSTEPLPEKPKELTENEKAELYVKENPVSDDYKLTAYDLTSIGKYLDYCSHFYNIDNKIGFNTGVLFRCRIILSKVLKQIPLNSDMVKNNEQ